MNLLNQLRPYLPIETQTQQINSSTEKSNISKLIQSLSSDQSAIQWRSIITMNKYIQNQAQGGYKTQIYKQFQQFIDQIENINSQSESEYCSPLSLKQKNYLMYKLYSNMSCFQCLQKKRFSVALGYLQRSLIYLNSVIVISCDLPEKVFLQLEKIKIMFYHNSIVSQIGDHQQAKAISSNIIHQLIKVIKDYLILFSNLLDKLSMQSQKESGYVDFRIILLKQAEQRLDSLSKINSPSQLVVQSKQQLNKIAKKLYSWKVNLENNQKYLLQSLNIDKKCSPRNILGLAKSSPWIQQFNIGDIMSIRWRQIEDLYLKEGKCHQIDPFYLFSNDKITQLCIFTSVSYFVIATETRLSFNKTHKQKDSLNFIKFTTSSEYQFCKILHLKAIQIAGKCMPEANRYISHLILSFNKNYKKFMQNITEEQSLIYAPSHIHQNGDTKYTQENNNNKFDQICNNTNRVHRKRTISSHKKCRQKTRQSLSVRKSRLCSINRKNSKQ